MLAQSFEIKVALLGHVSVGKTTVLNALFRDKFSEVSKKRTTAGINHFRVSSLARTPKKNKAGGINDEGATVADLDTLSIYSDFVYISSKETLDETTADNRALRENNAIQEKFFDVEIDDPLVEMRDNTRLVVVDVPGINEAHSGRLYLEYVEKAWDSLDCVIVVMDAHTGVNTEEKVELLKFVKKNSENQKEIPVIILCNKVDDPEDEEVMALVDEVRQEVQNIFGVGNSNSRRKKKSSKACAPIPTFIPVSAENAFLYRTASRLKLSEFKQLDRSYLEKIGHEEVGKYKWKKLSIEEKYKVVYNIVSNPVEYQERLEVSNFDNFLKKLNSLLGGKKNQESMIEKQLEVALKKLSVPNGMSHQLCVIYDQYVALGKPTGHIQDRFWSLFAQYHKDAFTQFHMDPDKITSMHITMKELVEYANGLHNKLHSATSENEKEEKDRIVAAMKNIIRQQCNVIIEKESSWTIQYQKSQYGTNPWDSSWSWDSRYNAWRNSKSSETRHGTQSVHPDGDLPEHWKWNEVNNDWYNRFTNQKKSGTEDKNPAPALAWGGMSPRDWSTAISSILLLSHNKYFYESFGKEIADLEWLARTGKFSDLDFCYNCKISSCGCSIRPGREIEKMAQGSYALGIFTPNNQENYDKVVRIQIPNSLNDPTHWGSLARMFCEFMECADPR